MINPGSNIQFILTGKNLSDAAKQAAMLVSTEIAAYAKMQKKRGMNQKSLSYELQSKSLFDEIVIPNAAILLNEGFFDELLELNNTKTDITAPALSSLFTPLDVDEYTSNKSAMSSHVRWLSVLMLALRKSKSLGLPFRFTCPISSIEDGDGKVRIDLGMKFQGSLLKSTRDSKPYDGYPKSSQTQGVSYCSKLILTTGWIEPADININDLVQLWIANRDHPLAGGNTSPPWRMMLSRLSTDFSKFSIPVDDFEVETKKLIRAKAPFKKARLAPKEKTQNVKKIDADILAEENLRISQLNSITWRTELFKVRSSQQIFTPDLLSQSNTIGFPKTCPIQSAKVWLEVENAYIAKIRRESYKAVRRALAIFNSYVFGYLHLWHQENPQAQFPYPDKPKLLKAGYHVSRLLLSKYENAPLSLMEYMREMVEAKEYSNETHYADVKQLESFFEFIELHSNELPHSANFKQPITSHDFPKVSRSLGTTKGLIPRKIFGFMLAYMECLSDFNEKLMELSLSDRLSTNEIMSAFKSKNANVLDLTNSKTSLVDAPSFEWLGKTIHLTRIPNIFNFDVFKTKNPDGSTAHRALPRPHALHQLIVAMQTGLRGNHIQWLDAETYATYADRDAEFTRLLVNTDKSKSSAWTPYVSKSVIKVLDRQKAWRDLIAEEEFSKKVYYNNNERTKWGKFLPLFAYYNSGRPYADNVYNDAWKSLLAGIQWTMADNGLDCPLLVRLRPTHVGFDGPDIQDKLTKAGKHSNSSTALGLCAEITPHSARVSVVSHFITALPADFIGKYITGQTSAVVGHYVKLDPDQLARLASEQDISFKQAQHQHAFERLFHPDHQSSDLINVGPDSPLATSFKANTSDAFTRFGCLSFQGSTDMKTGLEFCQDGAPRNVAFNKTEICPHGNHCPQEIIQELKSTNRCGLCPRAIRSVDHLPAVTAKCRQAYEELTALNLRMDALDPTLNASDIESMEKDRQRFSEELVGWIVSQEVLESLRKRMAENQATSPWIAQSPEIIQKALARVDVKTDETQYVLSRLAECEAYPALAGPEIRAQFDLLRRKLAANLGDFKTAFDSAIPPNTASACAGYLRSFVEANKLTFEEVANLLGSNAHLQAPNSKTIYLQLKSEQ